MVDEVRDGPIFIYSVLIPFRHVFPNSVQGPEAKATIAKSRELLLAQRQARAQQPQ